MHRFIPEAAKRTRSLGVLNFRKLNRIRTVWDQFLPDVKPFYAIKSFPNEDLLKEIASYGYGFDCASQAEIEMARRLAPESDIIYANPVRNHEEIKYAFEHGVTQFVIDSWEELRKIHEVGKGATYDTFVRIMSDELYSKIRFNSKFGCDIEDYKDIVEYANRNSIKIAGISFHVGSRCSDVMAYRNTLDSIMTNYLQITPNIKKINIGGGFETVDQIMELSDVIENFDDETNKRFLFMAEPGRLFSQSTLRIIAKITGIRKRIIDGQEIYVLTINDSVYHSFNGKILDGQKFTPLPLYDNKKTVNATIFGSTCDSHDLICENVLIPEPKIGDMLGFSNMGAYSLASCEGHFNGYSSCEVIRVSSE